MTVVAIVVHPTRPDAAALAKDAARWLEAHGQTARLLETTPNAPVLNVEELAGADLAVSLGGDGTFLRLVPLAYASDIPVMGVNFGRLGYLLEVMPEQFLSVLERFVDGDVVLEERSVLAMHVEGAFDLAPDEDRSLRRGGERWWVALNEVVVEKTVPGHMVTLSTTVDDEAWLSYKADGVLVATPTGSTAYNLSAGGPVLSPLLKALVLTPVAPHLTVGSSVVLRPDQVVTVGVEEIRPAVLVVDGREVGKLAPGGKVVCAIADRPIRFVSTGGRGFAGLLRSTLARHHSQ
jgi:NAD+ kinase